MSDPVTWLAIGSMAVSATGAYMSYQGGQQQSDYYSYLSDYSAEKGKAQASLYTQQSYLADLNAASMLGQAEVSEVLGTINQTIAERQALMVDAQTARETQDIRRDLRTLHGSQIVSYQARGGVEMEGSPAVVYQESTKQANEDIAYVLEMGALESDLYRAQGESSAAAASAQAMQQRVSGAVYSSQADQLRQTASMAESLGEMESSSYDMMASLAGTNSWGTLLTSVGSMGMNLYSGMSRSSNSTSSSSWLDLFNQT